MIIVSSKIELHKTHDIILPVSNKSTKNEITKTINLVFKEHTTGNNDFI